jgi:hypothetical protein
MRPPPRPTEPHVPGSTSDFLEAGASRIHVRHKSEIFAKKSNFTCPNLATNPPFLNRDPLDRGACPSPTASPRRPRSGSAHPVPFGVTGHPLPFALVIPMNPSSPSLPAADSPVPSPMIVTGLSMLARTRAAAIELKLDPLDFAVDLPTLVAAGPSVTDVRWLVAGGFVEQVRPRLQKNSGRRSSRRMADLTLTAQTRFVITPAGEKLFTASAALAAVDQPATPLLPHWDGDRRQLQFAGLLVKWFRKPAQCQETLLAAFQEDGWPPRIDDPLPRVADIDPKSRLHEAVRRLNMAQVIPLLDFYRDGTGEGVMWGRSVAMK